MGYHSFIPLGDFLMPPQSPFLWVTLVCSQSDQYGYELGLRWYFNSVTFQFPHPFKERKLLSDMCMEWITCAKPVGITYSFSSIPL